MAAAGPRKGTVGNDKLIMHNGSVLLNGMFGVGKGKKIQTKSGIWKEILRLIINRVPSNELQSTIEADVNTLPHFGQWLTLDLEDDEVLVWGSEDIFCAFYIFSLPEAWEPYFALDWPIPRYMAGFPDLEEVYLTLAVILMG